MNILKRLVGKERSAAVHAYADEVGYSVEPFDHGMNYVLRPTGTVKKLLVAHYDRVRFAPGANDNGAAVAAMLSATYDHWKVDGETMVGIVDLEEPGEFGMALGSAALAKSLQNDGIAPEHVIVFDVCGIGDCLAISSNAPPFLPTAKLVKGKATECGLPLMPLRMPPSDNISFMGSALIIAATAAEKERQRCWRWLHSADDDYDSIQPSAVAMVERYIKSLL